MIKLLLITLSVISLVMGGKPKVTSCSDNTGDVKIDICADGANPCQFKLGTTGIMNIDFTAPADSKTITADLTVHLAGVDIPHPTFDRDVCNDHGVKCPITKGNKYTYIFKMKVMPEYPKINTTFKFIAKDDSGNVDFCFTMPVQLIA